MSDDRMADKSNKPQKLKARLPRGLADRGPAEIAATRHMVEAIRVVFERYGFEPVETPAIEYTDALGKFLPDQDRPNEGVFSFQDDDEQWLSLRYDLTAPLARYVAENYQNLALPYRSYRFGYVYRNEKPGPGRFRQFMQFDADTVGAPTMAADAEMCMLAADTMEALGIPARQYVVKVNNRKVLDGVMDAVQHCWPEKRLTLLCARSTSSIVSALMACACCSVKAAKMKAATSQKAPNLRPSSRNLQLFLTSLSTPITRHNAERSSADSLQNASDNELDAGACGDCRSWLKQLAEIDIDPRSAMRRSKSTVRRPRPRILHRPGFRS